VLLNAAVVSVGSDERSEVGSWFHFICSTVPMASDDVDSKVTVRLSASRSSLNWVQLMTVKLIANYGESECVEK